MVRLVLILGDQLSDSLSALRAADPARDLVVMAEVEGEGRSVPHHPQKIVMILTAMRKFAAHLGAQGWRVAYSRLDDPDNSQTISGEVLRRAAEVGASALLATQAGEWRLRATLADLPLEVTLLPDDRFIASEADFAAWAKGRREWRMEWFYRDMRRRTGLLMEGDKPAGGKWNFDPENRSPAKPDLFRPRPPRFAPDAVAAEVMALVAARFPGHFGGLERFGWPTDRAQALVALDHFITHSLPRFGAEQDAMLADEPFLSHALLAPAINIGLLSPLEVCRAAEAAYHAGRVPIAAAEGFIRQIIGWREYVRGVWASMGPDYLAANALGHHADLPPVYWGAPTRMACMAQVVGQTRDLAYAHHIQRLMVLGNLAALLGVAPDQVQAWFLAVYADAFEWVEAPNVVGMSQFADGGRLGSKPYVATGAYINRMSDYCRGCTYAPDQRTGAQACPFTVLFWDFVARHAERFAHHPRFGQMVRNWQALPEAEQQARLADAARLKDRFAAGEVV